MNCRVAWGADFIDVSFTPYFRTGELRKHRQEVLLDRQKHLLPATQPLADYERSMREYRARMAPIEEESYEIWKNRRAAASALDSVNREIQTRPVLSKPLPALYELQRKLRNECSQIALEYEANHARRAAMSVAILAELGLDLTQRPDAACPRERSHFVRPCSTPDCRGFLNRDWKCTLCRGHTCKHCHVSLGPDSESNAHVCNADDVETAKLLMKDTKICPKCAVPIFRIDGCSQMFCTQCHCAFDWNTGRIDSGRIHNPHYYEWLRMNSTNGEIAREPGDGPGGDCPEAGARLPDPTIFVHRLPNAMRHPITFNMLQFVHHLRLAVLPYMGRDTLAAERTLEDLRVLYLLKELDEDTWKHRLYIKEQRQHRARAIQELVETMIAVGEDLLLRALEDTSLTWSTWADMAKEANALLNRASNTLARRFNSVRIPRIQEDWGVQTL